MRDQADKILRLFVLALAALLLAQLIRAGLQANPLAWVKIPPVPTLETNAISGTNIVAAPKGSNPPPVKVQSTNLVKSAATETTASPAKPAQTGPTNAEAVAVAKTNLPAANISLQDATNLVSTNLGFIQTNSTVVGTNAVGPKAAAQSGTRGLPMVATNTVTATKPTNEINKPARPDMGMISAMGFGGFPGMPGMPGPAPKLPPEVQARVDKIVDSEIFAPVMRPLPLALLGIAGDTAFLRTASGQTGLAKVNESVGEIKLLRIGTNRVLIEQDGQKKELTIFDGYGGDSLLPKQSENSK